LSELLSPPEDELIPEKLEIDAHWLSGMRVEDRERAYDHTATALVDTLGQRVEHLLCAKPDY
jgi:hypothetical protein